MLTKLVNRGLNDLEIKYRAIGRKLGTARLHYVVSPPFWWPYYFQVCHANKLMNFLMIESLRELGFDVVNSFYEKSIDIGSSRKLDLFIGHGGADFNAACDHYSRAKSVLLLTGADNRHYLSALKSRIANFNSRHTVEIGLDVPHKLEPVDPMLERTDYAFLIGNKTVMSTYNEEFQRKIKLIRNVTPFRLESVASLESQDFLFLSSSGQIMRGLDLILDSQINRKNSIKVCSSYKSEEPFYDFYRQSFSMPNIQGLGFVRTTERKFTKLCRTSTFSILPSCTEGISSSLINTITKGLIPIYTPICGLPFDDIGYCITDASVEGVGGAIDWAARLTPAEKREHSQRAFEFASLYQPESFKAHFKSVVQEIV